MILRGDILLIGYGNPGRLDDGLGPAFASAAEKLGLKHVAVESCYQLAVEHAEMVSRHDVVVFVDADIGGPEPFHFRRLEPKVDADFSTHRMMPETILGLAHNLFGATTIGYSLGIRGYQFDDFGESISSQARTNLNAAFEFLETALQSTGHEVC
ncbi:MAG: hydrogenase maturation protease [Pirellulales bacterium]|nr:hydrogenase maturation protease [Pirellulales bacterium]